MLYIRSDNECKYTSVFLNSNHVFWKRNLETLPWARNHLVLAVSEIQAALWHVMLGLKGNVPQRINVNYARKKELNKKSDTDTRKCQNEDRIKHLDSHLTVPHSVLTRWAIQQQKPHSKIWIMHLVLICLLGLLLSLGLMRLYGHLFLALSPARMKQQSSEWSHFVLSPGTAKFTIYMHLCPTRQTYHNCITYIYIYITVHIRGRTGAQAVSPSLSTRRPRLNPRSVHVGFVDTSTGTSFSRSTSVLPCQSHSTKPILIHSSLTLCNLSKLWHRWLQKRT
jgi:hypothetical protein